MKPIVVTIVGALALATGAAAPAFEHEIGSRAVQPVKAQLQQDTAAQSGAAPAFASSQAVETQPVALKAVQVTGSLIAAPNQVSASPIVSASIANLKVATGETSLATVVAQLPQFNATTSTFLGGSANAQTVNLRGLGANRNLVLLDGRRLPPADAFGDVAVNLIPEAAIGRLDVITGGASAIYGSDAMSGVVNFHTLPYFDGIKADVQYGNTTKSDRAQKSISVALGTGFDENKGHVLIALGDVADQRLGAKRRSFFDFITPSSYIGQGLFVPSGDNLPSQSSVAALFRSYGVNSPVSNAKKLGFNDDGTLFTENGAQNYKGPNSVESGYSVLDGNVRMPVGTQFDLGQQIQHKQAFGKFDYEVTNDATLYGQFIYSGYDTHDIRGFALTQFGIIPTIPVTNPFIPDDLKTLLATRPDPSAPFTLNARYVGMPGWATNTHTSISQYLTGVKGNLPMGDWTYDIYGSYSSTSMLSSAPRSVVTSQVQNLLNAPDGGNSICMGGFNPFGIVNSTNISQSCIRYMTATTHDHTKLSQTTIQGQVTGSLFQLPAGPVKLAFVADTRRNTYSFSPDAEIANANIEAVTPSQASAGSIHVVEGAVEVNVPLLSNRPFFKKLDLDAAFRKSHYDTSGSVNSYEADLKWHPVNSLLLRGGYQRAVRAPNIGELFSAIQGTQVTFGSPPAGVGDPCDFRSTARTGANGAKVRQLCVSQGVPASIIDTYTYPTTGVAAQFGGNTGLKPEIANTYNAGFQWTSESNSQLLRDMSLSIDYYNIDIKHVISTVSGLTTLSKCYNLDGSNPSYSPSDMFCQLLSRDPNGQLLLIKTPYENLGSLKTDGIDLQFHWSPSLSSLGLHARGNLSLTSYISYVSSYKIQVLPNGPVQNYTNSISVGNARPRWKAMTTLVYGNQDFSIGVRWNFLGAMRDASAVTSPLSPQPGTPNYNTYDLFGTYWLTGGLQVRFGLEDITNVGSVKVSSSQWGTDPSIYNPLGRRYFIGLHYSM